MSPSPTTGDETGGAFMDNVVKGLIGLSALAFILAVAGSVTDSNSVMGTSPEAFSRACSNLALVAIALKVSSK